MSDLWGLDFGAGKPRPYEKIDGFSTLATWINVSYYLFRSVQFLSFALLVSRLGFLARPMPIVTRGTNPHYYTIVKCQQNLSMEKPTFWVTVLYWNIVVAWFIGQRVNLCNYN